jgi:hypothetical protein
MISRTDPNFDVINAMVNEFTQAMGFIGTPDVKRIFTSHLLPLERQVLRVTLGEKIYALKLDFTSDVTERLAKEFAGLEKLSAHFSDLRQIGHRDADLSVKNGDVFRDEFP